MPATEACLRRCPSLAWPFTVIRQGAHVIHRLQLLRNIGQFDNVSPASTLTLGQLTLVYAENGRGKTTLAAVLRSLGTGDGLPINERRRLGAAHPPEVIIACDGSTQPARFQNGAWSRSYPGIVVFDDVFVDRNVYSGLDVAPEHRQNLHELIVGAQGVTLARRIDELASEIRGHNTTLRTKADAVPASQRCEYSIEEFCALPRHPDVDRALTDATQRLAAQQQAALIMATAEFDSLGLPAVDIDRIRSLLAQTIADLDDDAAAKVKRHVVGLGRDGEDWIASGMKRVTGEETCPFCAQPLSGAELFQVYRRYFVESYERLKAELFRLQTRIERDLRGDALAGFERQFKAMDDRRRFWAGFASVPDHALDAVAVAATWQGMRDGLLRAVQQKRMDPTSPIGLDANAEAAISAFDAMNKHVSDLSRRLIEANENIQRVKEATKAGDIAIAEGEVRRLRATKNRYAPDTSRLCNDYLAAKAAKEQAENTKTGTQQQLDMHQTKVFPACQAMVNTYLARLNAGFSIEQVQPQRTPGKPSCTYQLLVHQHRVPVSAARPAEGAAAFKNTLSAGDRNSLALAFFFASLEVDPDRARKTIVLDDPVSSLDEHRCVATIQETRDLVSKVAQVVVLSHNKSFLARIWQYAKGTITTLAVTRDMLGSTIVPWDVSADSVTEYDKRHARLRDYVSANRGNTREVAQSIRPVLEGYLRVACPANCPPGQLLGRFINEAQQQSAAGNPIIDSAKLGDLDRLTEFSNRFHHDTNPAWDTEQINDAELLGFVRQTLAFVRA